MPGARASAAESTGKAIAVLADLQGPKIRPGGSPTDRTTCRSATASRSPQGRGGRRGRLLDDVRGLPAWRSATIPIDDGRCDCAPSRSATDVVDGRVPARSATTRASTCRVWMSACRRSRRTPEDLRWGLHAVDFIAPSLSLRWDVEDVRAIMDEEGIHRRSSPRREAAGGRQPRRDIDARRIHGRAATSGSAAAGGRRSYRVIIERAATLPVDVRPDADSMISAPRPRAEASTP